MTNVKWLPRALWLGLALSALTCVPAAGAQSSRPASGLTLAQAERQSIDLKHGMSSEEVQRLLGKPRRTALKSNGSSADTGSQGALQWTYDWGDASTRGVLQVEFTAKTPDAWLVNSWQWASY